MEAQELQTVLTLHAKWLRRDAGGSRAYLADAYLTGAKMPEDYLLCTIGPIGSRNDSLTLLRLPSGEITISTGCFRGDLAAFAEAVQKTHGGRPHGQAYRAAIALFRILLESKPLIAQEEANAN